jgi:hypothetical protein
MSQEFPIPSNIRFRFVQNKSQFVTALMNLDDTCNYDEMAMVHLPLNLYLYMSASFSAPV